MKVAEGIIFLALFPKLWSESLSGLEYAALIAGLIASVLAIIGWFAGVFRSLWSKIHKKEVTPEQGAAVITKDSVIMFQPKPQFISRQDAERTVANSVRNHVRGQGRGMSGEPNITSAELKRDEELWYIEGYYAWQTGILQTVGFHAQVNARTGQMAALTLDN